MKDKKSHLILRNEIKSIEKFPKKQMYIPKDKKEEDKIEIKNYEIKKNHLRNSLSKFYKSGVIIPHRLLSAF